MDLKIEDFEILWKFCDFLFDFLCLDPDWELEEIWINFIFYMRNFYFPYKTYLAPFDPP